MASRQSVSSILKPPKVRPPLKEIEPVDPDSDENTASLPKRKVSFSGMNKIKMYNTGATSLTVNQAPMFDEHLSVLSDSSNAEKTKLSGNPSEKSDGQISLESTNCTNVENNARVIIEYESPTDNMEMTEALSGKILSDTIYTIDNNGSEHFDYNSDYSESNMEFTEAIRVGQILQADIESDLSCMSETLMTEEPITLSTLRPTSSHNKFEKNTSNMSLYCSNMDFTCANKKSNIMDQFCSNNQSSNMELTCMTSKSQKSSWAYNDSKLFNMELTKLSDRQMFEDNCNLEYDYDCSQNSIMESEVSHEIIENDISESENIKNPEVNYSYNQNIATLSKDTENSEDVFEKLSSSVVSMDIDPTSEENCYDIVYLNVNNTELVENEQNNSILPIIEVESKSDNCSNVIDLNYPNSTSKIMFMGPTDSSFVQSTSTEENVLEPVAAEELKEQFLAHTSVLDQNKYIEKKILIADEIKEKNYSRRTMKIMPTMTQESVLKSHSRKSIIPTSNLNLTQSCETEDLLNISPTLKEKEQNNYSIKLVESISDFELSHSSENENEVDKHAIDDFYEHKTISRKSIMPMSNFNQFQSCENKDLSHTSLMLNENEQDSYSSKLIESISDFDLTHSSKDENVSDTSAVVEEIKKKSYSRRTFGPSTLLAQNEFSDDSMCNNSVMSEECNELHFGKSTASMAPIDVNNASIVSSNNNIQQLDELKHYEEILMATNEHKSVLLNVNEDDFSSPFRKKSKKSIVLTNLTKQPTEHLCVKDANTLLNDNKSKLETDNNLENVDGVNEMDISIELESKNYIQTNMSSEKMNLDLPSSSALKNTSLIEKVPSNSSINKDVSFSNLPKNTIELEQSVNIPPTDINLLNDRPDEEGINNKDLKITDIDKINNVKHSSEEIINNICVESLVNMSISDEMHYNYEQSFIGNRKRSYSNRDYNVPLSCSTFISKDNVVEKKSPIKENIINEESIQNCSTVDHIEEEPLSIEVTEFLARWNDQFVEKKLAIYKYTNREWIFNVLDSNIVLIITYLPVINDNSFLKVEDISFTTKTITTNEILKFGINWILSKYNPKFFKQICFTSRDVELLLKSLLDDVHYISKVMKNMSYVGDMHCVTFKDSKAHFMLHNMDCLTMISFEILLSNIHKLSVKDIAVNCIFGFYNPKLLDEIMENVLKDCNILQSLIEQLKIKCFIRKEDVTAT